LARPEDSAAMLDIYAPYVRDTSLTFEVEVPTIQQFAERISSYMKEFPWIVYEVDGKIVGYAYASRYRERIAYQWSVECSVYIDPSYQKRKLGQVLYQKLFEILKLQEFRNVYAVINLPNEPSVTLHERMGFKWFATYEKVGYKLGRWKNVGWWGLVLNEFGQEPGPPIDFSKLDPQVVADILRQNN
jgi:L-amino acid N-acyltransferase YncA